VWGADPIDYEVGPGEQTGTKRSMAVGRPAIMREREAALRLAVGHAARHCLELGAMASGGVWEGWARPGRCGVGAAYWAPCGGLPRGRGQLDQGR